MPSAAERKLVSEILAAYDANLPLVRAFQQQLISTLAGSDDLANCTHSLKTRIKERAHLKEKLYRKIAECNAESRAFPITPDNLLTTINDICGVRILHLYTRQIRDIDAALRAIFQEYRWELLETPFARTWDDESREFFRSLGIDIETQDSPTLYTSVHYVIGSASQTTVTSEIQVRTLSEELWGEVDHAINYPKPSGVLACEEQLKVLARVTSGATRLVDSIFLTHEEAQRRAAAQAAAKRATRRRKAQGAS
jgi:putative GTP pyrophosphokinase